MFAACAADPTPIGRRDFALLQVLWWIGARRVSVAAIEVTDFRHENGAAVVRLLKKGGARYDVAVAGAVVDAIKAWQAAGGPTSGAVFARADGTPFNRNDISRVVARRAREAGLDPLPTPHQFRAAMITTVLDTGSLQAAQALAGHGDPRMTIRYDRGQLKRTAAGTAALEKARGKENK